MICSSPSNWYPWKSWDRPCHPFIQTPPCLPSLPIMPRVLGWQSTWWSAGGGDWVNVCRANDWSPICPIERGNYAWLCFSCIWDSQRPQDIISQMSRLSYPWIVNNLYIYICIWEWIEWHVNPHFQAMPRISVQGCAPKHEVSVHAAQKKMGVTWQGNSPGQQQKGFLELGRAGQCLAARREKSSARDLLREVCEVC